MRDRRGADHTMQVCGVTREGHTNLCGFVFAPASPSVRARPDCRGLSSPSRRDTGGSRPEKSQLPLVIPQQAMAGRNSGNWSQEGVVPRVLLHKLGAVLLTLVFCRNSRNCWSAHKSSWTGVTPRAGMAGFVRGLWAAAWAGGNVPAHVLQSGSLVAHNPTRTGTATKSPAG